MLCGFCASQALASQRTATKQRLVLDGGIRLHHRRDHLSGSALAGQDLRASHRAQIPKKGCARSLGSALLE